MVGRQALRDEYQAAGSIVHWLEHQTYQIVGIVQGLDIDCFLCQKQTFTWFSAEGNIQACFGFQFLVYPGRNTMYFLLV